MDTSAAGRAAWGNAALNDRVLDLLANNMFASDEIRDMVKLEHGFEPFNGFEAALKRIYADAENLLAKLAPDEDAAPPTRS